MTTPYYHDDAVTLYHGDCLEVLRTLPNCSIDAIVTDPPYGLSFMGKRWDYDVPSVEVWAECLRVLKPGGHLLAFAGTRTQHRMAVRIEDAGFEIRDMIAWVYGSGFPKSLDVSKAIDKAAGAEGTFGAPKSAAHAGWIERGRMRGEEGHEGYQRPWMTDSEAVDKNARQYIGGTEAAREWHGWGTALKPALEPITLARKPLIGTVAENVMAHGTGALNIDASRILLNGDYKCKANGRPSQTGLGDNYDPQNANQPDTVGRWPANLIHDGSDEVVGLFPDTGKSTGGRTVKRSGGGNVGSGKASESQWSNDDPGYGDSGSAARFFYCAKASKADRDEGCDGLAIRLRKTHGETGPSDNAKPNGKQPVPSRNHHPTVKPTALMRYLCRLVTPPGGVVFDPFTGSGSTGKGAVLEGFRFVGIEREADYMEIAVARIKAVSDKDTQGTLF